MKKSIITNLIKQKNIVIPMYFYKLRNKLEIDTDTFLFLMYLYNEGEIILFDVATISQDFGCELSKTMEYISRLQEKKLVHIEVIKNDKNIREEYISLEYFVDKISLLLMEEINASSTPETTEIFEVIEQSFGRTLNPIEYEIVKAWLESKYSKELIKEAVKEASFSGVANLRYIDKILYEWNKKGFKTKEDVEKNRVAHREKQEKQEVFDYDWMEDES